MANDTFSSFTISGIIFGLTSGLSPGPLLTLLVSETLHHDRKAGIRVALAPLLTDVPIVTAAILVVMTLSSLNIITGIISILGSLFLAYLAYENFAVKRISLDSPGTPSHALRKGILTNIFNPSPYMFWFTVGAPMVIKAFNLNAATAAGFITGFYLCLVGSKIILAITIDKSKIFLTSVAYIYSIRLLGLLLLMFAILFMKEGLSTLGVL